MPVVGYRNRVGVARPSDHGVLGVEHCYRRVGDCHHAERRHRIIPCSCGVQVFVHRKKGIELLARTLNSLDGSILMGSDNEVTALEVQGLLNEVEAKPD